MTSSLFYSHEASLSHVLLTKDLWEGTFKTVSCCYSSAYLHVSLAHSWGRWQPPANRLVPRSSGLSEPILSSFLPHLSQELNQVLFWSYEKNPKTFSPLTLVFLGFAGTQVFDIFPSTLTEQLSRQLPKVMFPPLPEGTSVWVVLIVKGALCYSLLQLLSLNREHLSSVLFLSLFHEFIRGRLHPLPLPPPTLSTVVGIQ